MSGEPLTLEELIFMHFNLESKEGRISLLKGILFHHNHGNSNYHTVSQLIYCWEIQHTRYFLKTVWPYTTPQLVTLPFAQVLSFAYKPNTSPLHKNKQEKHT